MSYNNRWQYQEKAEPFAIIPAPAPLAAETTLVIASRLTQIQSKAEPVFVPPAAVVPFDWYVATPNVIRHLPQTRIGFYARGYDNTEITPDFDWFVQHLERPIWRRHQTQEGLYVSPFEIELIEVDLDLFFHHP